jgi:lipopolysaccharide transport system permease protein
VEQSPVRPSEPEAAREVPVVRREARPGWSAINFAEIWRFRELLGFQISRDLKVRYKQTLLGAAWAILQPVTTMVVFSLFFGQLAKMPSDGVPYPIFVYCALLPWQLFATALTQCGNSLVNNSNLLTKVYFPRLLLPLSTVVSGLVDFAIAFVVLLGMMAYYGIVPGVGILLLPLLVLLAVAAALAVGLWLAALNVHYRDIRYVIPFLTQIMMFVTPVAYSASLVPAKWQTLYGLNPMAGIVQGFRWALLGSEAPGGMFIVSLVVTLLLLIGGAFYFQRMERTFADVV